MARFHSMGTMAISWVDAHGEKLRVLATVQFPLGR
jgi:hypothetical protein